MARPDDQDRAVVDLAPSMIWRAGADGDLTFVDARWLAYTGRAPGEELGRGWLTGVHPEDRSPYLARHLDSVERRVELQAQLRLRRSDGQYRWIVVRAVPVTETGTDFSGLVGVCWDRDEHLAPGVPRGDDEFFEMSIDHLCVAGLDGYFRRLNPAWTQTLGWSAEELMARPSIELVHPDDREATLAGRGRLREGGTLGPLRNRYLCKDGSHRWFEWRSNARPERGLVYASARDITEQIVAEQRLEESKRRELQMHRQLLLADRMASVGTLAAGVAHEINNPLASLTANVALILEELHRHAGAAPPQLLEGLRALASDAEASAERIRTIVGALATFSRAEEEQRVATDVRGLLEVCIGLTHNTIRHRARLVQEYGPIPAVEADAPRLGQVFVDLLVNAAQAIPEGHGDANEIRVVTSTDAHGRAVIEVRDTGGGIPADRLDRVFDPFFTTKAIGVGTGLGLSICHTIVQSIGGVIEVESRVGEGTTFRIVLPAASVPVPPPAPAPPPPRPTPPDVDARAAVLVVDDEPAIGVVLKRILRGHHVTSVTTAEEALALLAGGARFDVILSDLMMPGMSGMDFHEQLTHRFPEDARRVVFVSGGAFTPRARAFVAEASRTVIDKPFDAPRVRAVVEGFVRHPEDG